MKFTYIYWGTVWMLICLFCFLCCYNGCETPVKSIPQVQDTLTPLINTNKAENVILDDSLPIYRAMALKSKDQVIIYKVKYKTVYDSIYMQSDSAERADIELLNIQKLNQDSAYENELEAIYFIVNNQGKQIKNYKENEVYYDLKLKQDSVMIARLWDTLPKVKRKGFVRGFKWGAFTGALLTEAVNVAAKVKN